MIKNFDKIRSDIYYYLLVCYAFFLPTFNNFTTLIIVLLALVTIIDPNYIKHFWAYYKRDIVVIGFPLIFLLSCISLIYTSNYESGLRNFYKSLPFIIMPLILFKVKTLTKKQLKTIYKLFVTGCILTVAYSFSCVLYELIEGSYKKLHSPENHLRYFLNRITYHDLVSKNRVDHSIYFGSYILLAITLLKINKKLFSKRIENVLLILFFVTLILLTPIIICIAGLVIYSIFYFISYNPGDEKQNIKKLLIVSLSWAFIIFYLVVWKITSHVEFIYLFNNLKYNLVIAAGVITITILNLIAHRYYSYKGAKLFLIGSFIAFFSYIIALMFIDLQMKSLPTSNFTARLANNYASANIIKENFILGVGLGDVQDNLKILYKEIGFRKLTYNEHNQYLKFWLGSGILTFLIYILWIYKIILKGIKQKKLALICVSIILFLFSFTESILIRQMGSSFFLFFVFLFYFTNDEEVLKKRII